MRSAFLCLLSLSIASALGCAADTGADDGDTSNPFGGQTTGGGLSQTPVLDGGPATGQPIASAADNGSTITPEATEQCQNVGGTIQCGDSIPDDAPTEVMMVAWDAPELLCGTSLCEAVNGNICCDSWTDSGWGTPTCKPRNNCSMSMPGTFGAPQQWDLTSDCDGKDDCTEGLFCCFSMQGMPGAGAGRTCMTENTCNGGGGFGIEQGLGIYSCVDDSDCPRADQTCQAEVTGSETTSATGGAPFGKVDGLPGRDWVKVCSPN